MIDYAEKRSFIRMTMDCDMQLHGTSQYNTETVRLEDLSACGMRFNTSRALNEGEALAVTIQPLSDITPPMEAMISVVRCEQTAEDGPFDVRAVIDHILPAEYAEAEPA